MHLDIISICREGLRCCGLQSVTFLCHSVGVVHFRQIIIIMLVGVELAAIVAVLLEIVGWAAVRCPH